MTAARGKTRQKAQGHDVILSVALSIVLALVMVFVTLDQDSDQAAARTVEAVKPAPIEPPQSDAAARAVRLPQPPQMTLAPSQPTQAAPTPVLEPSAVAEVAPAVVPLRPRPAETSPPPPSARPTPPAQVVVGDGAAETKGRVLLRVLEHGKGPSIEIAWPQQTAQRAALYERFRTCFGMRAALMDDQGRLFNSDGVAGTEWPYNADLYSGFVRQASGVLVSQEQRLVSSIRKHHGLKASGVVVRLFPRRVDARLLGGLQSLLGQDYASAQVLQAEYGLENNAVEVRSIRVDGQPMAGIITLGTGAGC